MPARSARWGLLHDLGHALQYQPLRHFNTRPQRKRRTRQLVVDESSTMAPTGSRRVPVPPRGLAAPVPGLGSHRDPRGSTRRWIATTATRPVTRLHALVTLAGLTTARAHSTARPCRSLEILIKASRTMTRWCTAAPSASPSRCSPARIFVSPNNSSAVSPSTDPQVLLQLAYPGHVAEPACSRPGEPHGDRGIDVWIAAAIASSLNADNLTAVAAAALCMPGTIGPAGTRPRGDRCHAKAGRVVRSYLALVTHRGGRVSTWQFTAAAGVLDASRKQR